MLFLTIDYGWHDTPHRTLFEVSSRQVHIVIDISMAIKSGIGALRAMFSPINTSHKVASTGEPCRRDTLKLRISRRRIIYPLGFLSDILSAETLRSLPRGCC